MIFKRLASLIVNNLLLEVSPSKLTCSTKKNGRRNASFADNCFKYCKPFSRKGKIHGKTESSAIGLLATNVFASSLTQRRQKKFPRKENLTAYKYIHLFLIFCQIIRCNIFVFFDWFAAKKLSVLLLSQGQ